MWVKICANTNLADAQLAVELGADALGFVFAPSSRQVTVEQARAIAEQLPSTVETIGVVQTQVVEEIVATVHGAGLSGVQLHGGFNLRLARDLRARLGDGVTITQVLHWTIGDGGGESDAGGGGGDADRGEAGNAEEIAMQLQQTAAETGIDRVLIDSKIGPKIGAAGGGTGRSFDWNAARQALDSRGGAGGVRVVLAGGLRPENLAEAIGALKPWGVDVASGVEVSPGRKDAVRLRDFLAIARGSGHGRA